MNNSKGGVAMGVGMAGVMALCCGGPVILGLLASGALVGALGAFWSGAGVPIAVAGVVPALEICLRPIRRVRHGTRQIKLDDQSGVPEGGYRY